MHRKRRDGGGVDPVLAGGTLDLVFKRRRLRETARNFAAQLAFYQAVPSLRRCARAEGFVKGALVIRVASDGLASALERRPFSIVSKLPRLPDGTRVRWVRCTVGDLQELPDWSAPRQRPRTPHRQGAMPDAGAVTAALLAIEDPQLQQVLSSLFLKVAG